MKCPNCGNELEDDELASYQDSSISAVYCPECGWEGGESGGVIVDERERSDDEIPPGCATCGNNSIYPNCKSSCPMFDD